MDTSVKTAFNRIDTEYRTPTGPAVGGPPGWNGYSTQYQPAPAFSANRAFDKLAGLAILALVAGIFGYFAVPIGAAYGFALVAFVLVIVGWFRMRWARYLAPTYSLVEGLALGSISAQFASFGHGIVPTAVVFTAGVFAATLVLYRTGVVRVTPRMVSLAMMGGFGIIVVAALSFLGLPVPGLDSLTGLGLVFSVLALGIAVLNLFTDFHYVTISEAQGVSAEAEWSVAFAMMTALVLVYISMLRILAAAYGGGRRN